MQDLLSLDEIKTKTEKGKINVNKFKRIGKVLQSIVRLKMNGYDFAFDAKIHSYLMSYKPLTNEDQFKFSYRCEAKIKVK